VIVGAFLTPSVSVAATLTLARGSVPRQCGADSARRRPLSWSSVDHRCRTEVGVDDWETYRLATAYVLAAAREDRGAMDDTFALVLQDPQVLVRFVGALTRLAHLLVVERTGSEDAARCWLEDRVRWLGTFDPPAEGSPPHV
jgi:hypothetical protein